MSSTDMQHGASNGFPSFRSRHQHASQCQNSTDYAAPTRRKQKELKKLPWTDLFKFSNITVFVTIGLFFTVAAISSLNFTIMRGRCNFDELQELREKSVAKMAAQEEQARRRNQERKSSARYYEVEAPELGEGAPPMTTAYSQASIVHQAPWFTPRKICKAACCAETVAISLDQDDRRIITTADGPDLADLVVRAHSWPPHMIFNAAVLTNDMVQCIQPGTIIHSDSYGVTVKRFFASFRRLFDVPYLFITSDTDVPSPLAELRGRLIGDKRLIKWYGSNPYFINKTATPIERDMFVGFPVGLSKYHPQLPYLTHYQQHRNFTNPYLGEENKKRWTQSLELATAVDTTPVLFVNFDYEHPGKKHRKGPHDMACKNRITVPQDNVTCSLNPNVTMHETYLAASHYIFGLSPPGEGHDCYRTYEYWMLGVIPIVRSRPDNDLMFEGLPFIALDHWNYTQSELLTIMRDYVASEAFQNNTFDGWEKLFLSYWRRKILKDTNRTADIVKDDQGREYYQAWKYSMYKTPQVIRGGRLFPAIRELSFFTRTPEELEAEKQMMRQQRLEANQRRAVIVHKPNANGAIKRGPGENNFPAGNRAPTITNRTQIRSTQVTTAQVTGTQVTGTQVGGAQANGAQVKGAKISEVQGKEGRVKGAQVSGAPISGAQVREAQHSGVQMRGAQVSEAQAVGAATNRIPESSAWVSVASVTPGSDAQVSVTAANETSESRTRVSILPMTEISEAQVNAAPVDEVLDSGAQVGEAQVSRTPKR